AFNYGAYRSSSLDAMLDEARAAAGPVARAPILARIAKLLADEQPVLFLYRYDVPALVSGRVRGLAAVGDRFDLRRVWLEYIGDRALRHPGRRAGRRATGGCRGAVPARDPRPGRR